MSTLSADEVLTILRDAIAVVMEIDGAAVTREMRFVEDLRADSLALVEIVDILEEQLAPLAAAGFRIDDDDLDAITTVGQAVDYAVARL